MNNENKKIHSNTEVPLQERDRGTGEKGDVGAVGLAALNFKLSTNSSIFIKFLQFFYPLSTSSLLAAPWLGFAQTEQI